MNRLPVPKGNIKRTLLSAAVLLLLPLQALAGPDILVLHSYHPDYEWTASVEKGLRAVFEENVAGAELFVEYMDTKRHAPALLFPTLLHYYRRKYANKNFDVILCVDDNALDFLLAFREKLFPGVPVVFCGINRFDKYRISGHRDYTGVVEELDLQGTLDLALQLHPKTRKVAVVSDFTTSGRANLELFRKITPFFPRRIEFIEFAGLEVTELEKALSVLPPDTVVLYLSYYRDPAGQTFSLDKSLALVTGSTDCPIYAPWDFTIQNGVIGGRVVSGRIQGETAARLAFRILNGEPVDNIRVDQESPNVYMFDYSAIMRFGIDPAQLPVGSVVLNNPNATTGKERRASCLSMGLATLLGGGGIGLAVVLLIRRRDVKTMREGRQLFRTMADLSHGWEMWCSPEGRIEYVSPSCERITGYGSAEFLEDPALIENVVHPADQEAYRRHRENGDFSILEFRIISRDGQVRWIESTCLWAFDDQGNCLGLRLSNRDVTDRVVAEKDCRDSESNLQAMLQSIPDHVFMLDASFHIVWANEAAMQTFSEQIIGAQCHEVFHGRTAPCKSVICPVVTLFGDRPKSFNYDLEILVNSGEKRFFHCTATVPVRDEKDVAAGVLIVARDMTEPRRAEIAVNSS